MPACGTELSADDLNGGGCGKRLPTRRRKSCRPRTLLINGILALLTVGCGVLPPVSQVSSTPGESPSPGVIPAPATTATPLPPGSEATADPYEPDDSLQEASPITTDGLPQPHNLHRPGDHDHVYFEAHEGTAHTIETSHLGADVDTIIYLYDSEGDELAHADDGAEEPLASRIVWIAPSSGTYYVMIRDLRDDSAGPESKYEVRITASDTIEGADRYEPDDSISQARPIETDGTHQNHTFHVTVDVDYVSFLAEEGVEYTIETGNLGGDCDTVIYLYDGEGTELDYDDDRGEEAFASSLVWVPPEGGIYYVAVKDFHGQAGPELSYGIWISQ